MFLPGFPLTFLVTIIYPLASGAFAQLIGICNLTTLGDSFVAFLRKAGCGLHVFTRLFLYSLHELAQISNEIQGRAFALEKTFLLVTNWSDGEIQNDRRVFFPLRRGKLLQKTLCRLAASFTSKIVGLKNLICISECNGVCKIILKASLLGRCSYD